MKTIYFVRHGQSESNVRDIMSGSGDNIGLTSTGRDQAKLAGERLKSENIELIVCSPLQRAVDTANIIADEIGYDPALIVTNPLLVERSYGIYDGGPNHVYDKAMAADDVHESVETTEQMHERFTKALQWIESLEQDKIVVVSHGGARRAIHVISEGLHHSHMYKLESFGNGEIYKFEL